MSIDEDLEDDILELIAMDRLAIPISSMSAKLKRQQPELAKEIDLGDKRQYQGQRCYARIEDKNLEKARTLSEGIKLFSKKYPEYGDKLKEIIKQKREVKETHLYYGMNKGCILTEADYIGVMQSLGFTETTARSLYPELMAVSRSLAKKRKEERKIMIG